MQSSPEPIVATVVGTIICPRCAVELDSRQAVCSSCGVPTTKAVTHATPTNSTPLLDRPWFILGLLFLAALVLGLPFLWQSRAFKTRTKFVIAILVMVETVVVFWAFALIMMWCYRTIMDSWQ